MSGAMSERCACRMLHQTHREWQCSAAQLVLEGGALAKSLCDQLCSESPCSLLLVALCA